MWVSQSTTFYRRNSFRNCQIDQIEDAWPQRQPADWSLFLYFIQSYESKFAPSNNVVNSPRSLFDTVLFWLCVGPIPVGICNLTNLIELSLSNNQLAGQCDFIFTRSNCKDFPSRNRKWWTSPPLPLWHICFVLAQVPDDRDLNHYDKTSTQTFLKCLRKWGDP